MNPSHHLRSLLVIPRVIAISVTLAVAAIAATAPAMAGAPTPAPAFEVRMISPDAVTAGDKAMVNFAILNAGSAPAGGQITVTETVSDGLTLPDSMDLANDVGITIGPVVEDTQCEHPDSTTLTCTLTLAPMPPGIQLNLNPISGQMLAVDPGATGDLSASVSVSGGGAPPVTSSRVMEVGPSPAYRVNKWTGAFSNIDGSPALQAGGAPSLFTTTLAPPNVVSPYFGVIPLLAPLEHLKDGVAHLPPGLVANPMAVPKCSYADLTNYTGRGPNCPPETQIGVFKGFTGGAPLIVGLFNVEAPYGAPGRFAFNYEGVVVQFVAKLRPDDYGFDVASRNTSTSLRINDARFDAWGVPNDISHGFDVDQESDDAIPSTHDGFRGGCVSSTGSAIGGTGGSCPSSAPPRSFLRMPTVCGTDFKTGLEINTYQHPDVFHSASFTTPPLIGCDRVPFDPALSVVPTSREPDSPTGLDVSLSLPQTSNPSSLQTADLRRAVVALPEGMTINPSSADGLAACSDAQLGLGRSAPAVCPDGSKIGSVALETPALDHPLGGSVFVRSQNSSDPGSGEMFRIAIEVRSDEDGIVVKLPGAVRANPDTGRLETTFDDNPQLPFSKFKLRFFGGSRAALANGPDCGTQTLTSTVTGWNGAVRHPSASFSLECPGVRGFSPSFEAGSRDPVGGAFSPFSLLVQRPDGQQYMNGLSMTLPTGITAKIAGVAKCPEAQIDAGTCGASSRVGTATVGAGAGSDPFYIDGGLHFTGPYHGAPFGLAAIVRVVAGPYDLGTVVVRQALYVDPVDAHVTVVSDPFPVIVKGVPVRLRSIDADIDRPGYLLNPTSCAEKQIQAQIRAVDGQTIDRTDRFHVLACSELGFTPKVALALTGSKAKAKVRAGGLRPTAKSLGLTDGGHPDLTAHLTMQSGGANLSSAEVTLPLSLALDPENANGLCEPSAAEQNKCPKASIVGQVRAVSPILDGTLDGPVYFVRGERKDAKTGRIIRSLPTLFIPLTSSTNPLLVIYLKATSEVQDDHLVTTFKNIPDAPVGDFTLKINGGSRGILVVSGKNGLCSSTEQPFLSAVGQNGKRHDGVVPMSVNCPLAVLSSGHTARSLHVKIGGLGAGRVSATANGATKASRTISSAGIATLSLPLKKSVRTRLTAGRNARVTVKVAFTPKGAKKARRINKTLIIHAN